MKEIVSQYQSVLQILFETSVCELNEHMSAARDGIIDFSSLLKRLAALCTAVTRLLILNSFFIYSVFVSCQKLMTHWSKHIASRNKAARKRAHILSDVSYI